MTAVLSKDEVRAVYDLAQRTDLALRERRLLLMGLPSALVGHMPQHALPLPQLLSDLGFLNTIWRAPGCAGPPLLTWLRNAARLTAHLADVQLFGELGDRLDLRVALRAAVDDEASAFSDAIAQLARPDVAARIGGLATVRRIWTTGDDGTRSAGLRLLTAFLQERQAGLRGARPDDDTADALLQLGELRCAFAEPPVLDLPRVDLRGLTLRAARLPGVELHGGRLDEVDLSRADLRGVGMRDAALIKTNLKRCKLQGADLMGATLTAARLDEARLQDAILDDVAGNDARFTGATLTGASARGSRLDGARFGRARASRADFAHASLVGAGFRRARLADARFGGAQLQRALFVDAILRGADLTHANLAGASVEGADLRGATFTDAELTDVRWAGAKVSADTRLPPGLDVVALGAEVVD